MIQIIVKEDSLKVSGHANAGTKGNDIVCAAVSTLVTGAAELWKDSPGVEIERGEEGESICFLIRLKLKVVEKDVKYGYIFLTRCLELVAKNYPENIRFTQV